MKFLKYFPKNSEGLYIVYELYSFDNFFRLLLKHGFDHENALYFIFTNCVLSAVVFQERIHNKAYLKLRGKDALSPRLASIKAMLIFDILQCIKD
ncbi:MAG TPA: hypothetical protein VJB39_03210 [Patescibacteria group bacterium]|nr:hypothetical protein [Patescibacteria group bacterium]